MQRAYLFVGLVLFVSFTIVSCTQKQNGQNWQRGQGMPQWRNGSNSGPGGRNFNLTEEQRQQMMQEREQQAQAACEGKREGDSCSIENPRGKIDGTCKMTETNLTCTIQGFTRSQ